MVHSQLRRPTAALALAALLSLIPGSASAAGRPQREPGRMASAKPRVESRRSPGMLSLALLLLEKTGIRIDPNGNGLTTSPDGTDPH